MHGLHINVEKVVDNQPSPTKKGHPVMGCPYEVFISALAVDVVAALGAGDDDLTLALGHATDGMAVGTGEILVVLVLHLLQLALHRPPNLLQKLGVLGAALGQVFGKHAEQRPEGQQHGHQADHGIGHIGLDENIGDMQRDSRPDRHHSQMIRAVTAVHKAR